MERDYEGQDDSDDEYYRDIGNTERSDEAAQMLREAHPKKVYDLMLF